MTLPENHEIVLDFFIGAPGQEKNAFGVFTTIDKICLM